MIDVLEETIIRVQDPMGITLPAAVVRVSGVTPLLQNNPLSMLAGGGAKKTIPTPRDEAESKAYRDTAGALVIPTAAFRAAILQAAAGFRINKQSARTILSGSLVLMPADVAPLLRDDAPITAYEIDTRRAVVQRQGVLRSRPRIPTPWQVLLTLAFDLGDDRASSHLAYLKVLLEIFENAGRFIGVGDFRPQVRGTFGRFTVALA